jgi:hypothetical protein
MDLDRQVVPLVAKQLLRLLLRDDSCAMVRIDDVVADLEVADWRLNLEVGDLLFGYLGGGTDCCLLVGDSGDGSAGRSPVARAAAAGQVR